ncbi:competence protein CoiA family protein [Alteromonas gracilis]|uniref:competence protein CoiA family protein n=1 Tax=Alteromonas gracilis TaxID=1479524 RepID=UPI0037359B10
MNGFTLIPFGLHLDTNRVIDVGSVPNGMKCQCICPSCKTPLIARHGAVKEWHFAHQSRDVQKKTEKPCDYSFAVSVRLMMKQLFEQGAKLCLPAYSKKLSSTIPGSNLLHSHRYIIAEEKVIEFDSVEAELNRYGVIVDLVLGIGDFELIVYITYDGRHIPHQLKSIDKNSGVIEFNVMSLMQAFEETQSGQYKDVLIEFLAHSHTGKFWHHHPREERFQHRHDKFVSENREALLADLDTPRSIYQNTNNYTGPATQTNTTEIANAHKKTLSSSKQQSRINALEKGSESVYVLLGSHKASYENDSGFRENTMGKYTDFRESMLHLCIKCEHSWEGKSNLCNQCQSFEYTRSVF